MATVVLPLLITLLGATNLALGYVATRWFFFELDPLPAVSVGNLKAAGMAASRELTSGKWLARGKEMAQMALRIGRQPALAADAAVPQAGNGEMVLEAVVGEVGAAGNEEAGNGIPDEAVQYAEGEMALTIEKEDAAAAMSGTRRFADTIATWKLLSHDSQQLAVGVGAETHAAWTGEAQEMVARYRRERAALFTKISELSADGAASVEFSMLGSTLELALGDLDERLTGTLPDNEWAGILAQMAVAAEGVEKQLNSVDRVTV